MVKKILALICALTFISAAVPASVTYASEDEKTEVLTKLGLLEGNGITNDGFIKSLAGYLFDDSKSAGNAEDIARSTGMIENFEEYKGTDVLTVNQALKYAVVTLGYKVSAESSGGFPNGYIQTASRLGLTKDVTASGESILRKDTAVTILYNMLDAEPMLRFYNGEFDKGYTVAEDETLLSINRDIYKIEGLMTGTELTSIYGDGYAAGAGFIAIDEISYAVNTNEYDKLLGRNVIAYAKKSRVGDYEIVYVHENLKKNNVININKIEEIGDKFSFISYYESEDSQRTKKVKLTASPRVIYNGVFLKNYTVEDFLNDNGSLELIDNNNDGKYDVVLITAYRTMVVESVDYEDLLIRNRYKFSGCMSEIELDDDCIYNVYDGAGIKTEFEKIRIDDVINVAASKDKKIVNIYISDAEPITGTVTKLDPYEEEIYIDNTAYKTSDDFEAYISDTSKEVKYGETYIFLTDYFGKLAYLKAQVENDYKVLLRIYQDEQDDIFYAVYMDMNADWYTVPISGRVKIDNISYKNSNDAMEAIMYDDPQVVLLKQNSKGEITKIDRAAIYTGDKNQKFCMKPEAEYIYRSPSRCLESGNNLVYLEDNAKIIIWPTKNVRDKESWKVESANGFFGSDLGYTVAVYSPDEYMFTDLLTIKMNDDMTRNRASKSMYVITGFEQKLVDNEVLPAIVGNVGAFRNLSFVGNEDGIFDGYKAGDIVNLSLNSKGRIDYIEKVFSLSDFASQNGSMYAESTITSGIIKNIDLEKGRIMVNSGIEIPYRIGTDTAVMVYDALRNKCESNTVEALKIGDNIVCRVRWGSIAEIVCLKNGGKS